MLSSERSGNWQVTTVVIYQLTDWKLQITSNNIRHFFANNLTDEKKQDETINFRRIHSIHFLFMFMLTDMFSKNMKATYSIFWGNPGQYALKNGANMCKLPVWRCEVATDILNLHPLVQNATWQRFECSTCARSCRLGGNSDATRYQLADGSVGPTSAMMYFRVIHGTPGWDSKYICTSCSEFKWPFFIQFSKQINPRQNSLEVWQKLSWPTIWFL